MLENSTDLDPKTSDPSKFITIRGPYTKEQRLAAAMLMADVATTVDAFIKASTENPHTRQGTPRDLKTGRKLVDKQIDEEFAGLGKRSAILANGFRGVRHKAKCDADIEAAKELLTQNGPALLEEATRVEPLHRLAGLLGVEITSGVATASNDGKEGQ